MLLINRQANTLIYDKSYHKVYSLITMFYTIIIGITTKLLKVRKIEIE